MLAGRTTGSESTASCNNLSNSGIISIIFFGIILFDIEIAPLAFMRGRTLENTFIILDEAQNTTNMQMKMFVTRLGRNSKMVILGDITQIDLPAGSSSGLKEILKLVPKDEGIDVVNFQNKDIVRHRLVDKIVKAYSKLEKQK